MSGQVFRLPDLGEGLTEAEVVRWLVAEGETVAVDQPVVEVETAKSLVEVPTPYAGKVSTRHAPEGSVLEVGKPLLTVEFAETPAETYREEERAGSGNVLIGYGTPGASSVPGRRRRPRASVTPAASAPTAKNAQSTNTIAQNAQSALPQNAQPAPAQNAQSAPSQKAQTAPAQNAQFAPPRNAQPTPEQNMQSAPPRNAQPTPEQNVQSTPLQNAQPTPEQNVQSTPLQNAQPAPAQNARSARARVPLVVSPLVRRLAQEGGVDLSAVDGSGPGGLIVRADVSRELERALNGASHALNGAPRTWQDTPRAVNGASNTSAAAVAGETRIPLTGFRKAVSAALTRSRSEIPEATVWVDVDATRLWELREATRPGPGILAYLARFTVAALREFPVLNARVDTERQEIVQLERIDLGIAVQGKRGLVVPAVTDAGAMTTAGLDREIRRVTEDAREGTVHGSGTFTLNNYGGFRVDGSAAIINHPQVAILGFGRILDRPWVVDGQICVRKITQMSFVFDHRVCDGGTAAGFMRSVADAIEDPASAIARL
ncbi:2-oxo acid dehydrogenase subunit E2 [Actinoplanes sp. LDG1-06]|uniref:Dihydrolipoamide acetyltransferase component of pyruvate dehydrogenase complex n=1 Tax=Paractinoplanes ovalisporus TaxID=2810368 RepID=A0ABS2A3U4_9ACTN|nr:dihydrolipoamide acetyltransferase family protein [Actinoplanes ovalisporus]MBM2614523.1 2-oxo acid dehydrogenase subunit E2 [Actinoplanes ovalisporus]